MAEPAFHGGTLAYSRPGALSVRVKLHDIQRQLCTRSLIAVASRAAWTPGQNARTAHALDDSAVVKAQSSDETPD
mgnify:CR=1 FL=1